ncbi:MAG: DUF4962 domain-containing protein [Verrucomicrobia bacterium]|nr:DUF4962 domain-containing protein [Verrucomicrobiota bacterium]
MKRKTQFSLWLAGSLLCLPLFGAQETQPVPVPTADQILRNLKREHPRLLATATDFAQLKQRVATDPTLKKWHAELRRDGARILDAPPSKYEIPDGLRLLATSRRVWDRVQTMAMLYRLDGDKRYAERAWKELEAAANFKDWNPRHFLDTAEMTHAFAIGYDWLYDVWSDEQRATLRTAMVEKGIKLAIDIQSKNTWWAKSRHNWNQVCNGGVGMGALALADVEPKLAGDFLHAALKSIQLAMAEYGPDGAWAEGPGYWNYATTYNVVFLASLQTALGSDFGLTKIEGFSEAGSFPIYASGPTGLSFSYADSHAGVIRSPVLFWLARQFNRPDYAWYQSQLAKAHPLDLLWYDARLAQKPSVTPPLDRYYRNSEITLMRSAWDDKDALFVGFKSGDNKANHSNLDLGSFVLDALGVRWAEDIGADDYNLPAYFGNKRWTYYRLRAEGHNTLVINPGLDPDQEPRAAAKITKFDSKPERAVAVTDLTAAYAKHVNKAQRGMAMLGRKQVLVQDEVQAKAPAEVWWFLHTHAKPQVGEDGRTATLTDGKARLHARIVSPAQARFQVMKAEPLPAAPQPPKQGNNSRYQKLAIQLRDVTDTRIAVVLTPLKEGEAVPAAQTQLTPLATW